MSFVFHRQQQCLPRVVATAILVLLMLSSLLLFAVSPATAFEETKNGQGQRFLRTQNRGDITFQFDVNNNNNFDPNVTEYWFDDAVVDHFNFRPTPKATFSLRYYVNDQYYDYYTNHSSSSSPVLFYAGNEADIFQFVKNSGFLWEAAKELGAMIIFCEHRYYGKSFPLSDPTHNDDDDDDDDDDKSSSMSPQNISYLTVEQAMADFNTLQDHVRSKWNMTRDAAFIVTGGSYGGNLALWLRLKNPNLWAGALASSATPLKHKLRETNAFNRIVADVYGNVSTVCPDKIRQGWKELFDDVETVSGRENIQKQLKLCHIPNENPPEPKGIAHSIHGWIAGALETMVQYGYPYPTEFYNPVPAYPFKVACEDMLDATSGLEALYAAANVYYNYTGQAGSCFDWLGNGRSSNLKAVSQEAQLYWNRVGQLDRLDQLVSTTTFEEKGDGDDDKYYYDDDSGNNDDYDQDLTGSAWNYQCCTEVYQPMPTDGITDFELPHTPNQTQYFESCQRKWDGVTPRPNWEESTFWSDNIQAGSNIFLSSGQLDPWRAAGIQSLPRGADKSSIIVRIIENGAHHLDLRSSHPLDPPSVVDVRKEELQAMREWIQQWQSMYPATKTTDSTMEDTAYSEF